jgi:hypothetical protein
MFRAILIVFMFVIQITYPLRAAEREASRESDTDSSQVKNEDELILETIDIKGEVDQPGVIFMPKRIEPELSDVDLERSFEDELKSGTGDVPSPVESKHHVEDVKDVKKIVKRKRQSNSN